METTHHSKWWFSCGLLMIY